MQRVQGFGVSPARVAADERLDDGAPELLAQVERDVRQPALVAEPPRGEHRRGRAARALGLGRLRVDPEAERHAERLRPGAQQRHGAVDAAAHRDRDAAAARRRRETPARSRPRARRSRDRRRARRPPRAGYRPREVLGEPLGVGVDDPLAVDPQPDRWPTRRSASHLRRRRAPGQSTRRSGYSGRTCSTLCVIGGRTVEPTRREREPTSSLGVADGSQGSHLARQVH